MLIMICLYIVKTNRCYAHSADTTVKHFIHQIHGDLKKSEKDFFNLKGKKTDKQQAFQSQLVYQLDNEVLGFYPFWEKDYYKEINFSLLSTVTYFSYEVNPSTGKYKTVHDWEQTDMIDSALAMGTSVLLTVTNFGDKDNHELLSNSTSVNTLISTLVNLLTLRKANGVCIDFEGISHADRDLFTAFVTKLNTSFKSGKYTIYITVPNEDIEKPYDYAKLIPLVSRFVIMGYPYHSNVSETAGPISPIQSGSIWNQSNLSTTVTYYLSNKISASTLILSLPYYGIIWNTDSTDVNSKVKQFKGYRTYSYFKSETPHVKYDSISKSVYAVYSLDNKKQIRQSWFENDSTIAAKLKFVKEYKLAGMGIWALGYDKGYDNLWKVISTELVSKPVVPKDSTSVANLLAVRSNTNAKTGNNKTAEGAQPLDTTSAGGFKAIEAKLKQITDYKTVLLYVLSFVCIAGCIGFLVAMFSPNTRLIFFSDSALRWYFVATVLVFIIVFLRLVHIIDNANITLILGAVLGSVSYYAATKFIQHKNNNIP